MADNSTTRSTTHSAVKEFATKISKDEDFSASEAAVEFIKVYARERPEVVALWALGIGFILGWKLKPW